MLAPAGNTKDAANYTFMGVGPSIEKLDCACRTYTNHATFLRAQGIGCLIEDLNAILIGGDGLGKTFGLCPGHSHRGGFLVASSLPASHSGPLLGPRTSGINSRLISANQCGAAPIVRVIGTCHLRACGKKCL